MKYLESSTVKTRWHRFIGMTLEMVFIIISATQFFCNVNDFWWFLFVNKSNSETLVRKLWRKKIILKELKGLKG